VGLIREPGQAGDVVTAGAEPVLCDLESATAEAAGVRRFLLISAMGTDREIPQGTDPAFATYLWAKTAAERDIRRRGGLGWTILQPWRRYSSHCWTSRQQPGGPWN
jgi:uncharacterized protein YbjT (DUF2867 family)